jgi:hypothetical protein
MMWLAVEHSLCALCGRVVFRGEWTFDIQRAMRQRQSGACMAENSRSCRKHARRLAREVAAR